MKNAKIMATIVAVFFSILLTGTANAGKKVETYDRQVSSGQIGTAVMIDDCIQKWIFVHASSEESGVTPFIRIHASVQYDNYCTGESSYIHGTADADSYSSENGVVEFSGTVKVSDGSEEFSSIVTVDITLTASAELYSGSYRNISTTKGPDGFRSRYVSTGNWKNATAVGYMAFDDGVVILVDGGVGQIDETADKDRTVFYTKGGER